METNKITKANRSQAGQQVPDMTEDQAREHIEKLLWPDGQPVCPHCGSVNAYRMRGDTCRPGLCRCREKECEKQFTVTVGTIFEDTHIKLAVWVKAFHYIASSKKSMSSLQLQRNLGLGSYRTAWHMAHRIRLAMRCEPMANALLSGIVESDEAHIGGKPRKIARVGPSGKQGRTPKTPIHALVERDGRKMTRVLPDVTAVNLKKNFDALVSKDAEINTDESSSYDPLSDTFKVHKVVNHSKYEYFRAIDGAGINTAESGFALFKRGVHGTFHHISKKHMQRYLDEFDYRWNGRKVSDVARRETAIRQVVGKRLMYKSPVLGSQAQ